LQKVKAFVPYCRYFINLCITESPSRESRDRNCKLLKGIAKAGLVASPQSSEFIRRYGLPSASSVKTALDVLLDKELVYHQPSGYVVYDRFLALWLKQLP
jgi:hypothetical protein